MSFEKKENCGLFGIYGDAGAVEKTYLGLYSLQHRGQESAGIASSDGEFIRCYTGMGTVGRVFRSGRGILEKLSNRMAIGLVRSSTRAARLRLLITAILSMRLCSEVNMRHTGVFLRRRATWR